jgi:hypothetical protein
MGGLLILLARSIPFLALSEYTLPALTCSSSRSAAG